VLVAISVVNSFHPSAQQNPNQYLNIELDVEKRIQAWVLKDRIRIKEFFIDFDKLRKGYVGEAGVSILQLFQNISYIFNNQFKYSSEPASAPSTSDWMRLNSNSSSPSTLSPTVSSTMLRSAQTSTVFSVKKCLIIPDQTPSFLNKSKTLSVRC
jgi:hypothetical protein